MTRRPALLLLALLGAGALAACGGGGDGGIDTGSAVAATGPADKQAVTVVGTAALQFEPAQIAAKTGSLTITLGNQGGTPHNLVFEDTALAAIDTVGADQEKSATYTFTSGGTYGFVCTFHPGMKGSLTVS